MLNFRRTRFQHANNCQTTKGSKLGYIAFVGELQIWVKPLNYDKKPPFRLETHKVIKEGYWDGVQGKGGKFIDPVWEVVEYGTFSTSKEALEVANKLYSEGALC